MNAFLYSFIYIISLIFCCYDYLDEEPKMYTYALSIILGTMINFLIRSFYGYNVIQIIFILLNSCFIIYLLNKRINTYLLFYILFFINVYTFVFSFIQIIMSYISYLPFTNSVLPNSILAIITMLMFLLIVYIFNKFTRNNIIVDKSIIDENTFLFCLINVVTLLIYIFLYAYIHPRYYLNIPMQCLLSSIYILWIYFIQVFNHQLKIYKQATQNILMNRIYQDVEQFRLQYQQNQEDIYKLNHDMKNHLLIIKNLDNKKDIEEYIDNLYPKLKIQNHKKTEVSGNVYIDTILYIKKREYPHITFHEDFAITDLDMNHIELCSLMFNLIDNACQNTKGKEGMIDIHMSYENPHLKIYIKNSFQDEVSFVSKKGNNHGYGMKIIQDIVNKYDGSIEYKILDKEVLVKILLVI